MNEWENCRGAIIYAADEVLEPRTTVFEDDCQRVTAEKKYSI